MFDFVIFATTSASTFESRMTLHPALSESISMKSRPRSSGTEWTSRSVPGSPLGKAQNDEEDHQVEGTDQHKTIFGPNAEKGASPAPPPLHHVRVGAASPPLRPAPVLAKVVDHGDVSG